MEMKRDLRDRGFILGRGRNEKMKVRVERGRREKEGIIKVLWAGWGWSWMCDLLVGLMRLSDGLYYMRWGEEKKISST